MRKEKEKQEISFGWFTEARRESQQLRTSYLMRACMLHFFFNRRFVAGLCVIAQHGSQGKQGLCTLLGPVKNSDGSMPDPAMSKLLRVQGLSFGSDA